MGTNETPQEHGVVEQGPFVTLQHIAAGYCLPRVIRPGVVGRRKGRDERWDEGPGEGRR